MLQTTCGNFIKFTIYVQLGMKGNRVDFEVDRSEGKVTAKHCQISTFGGIFSPVSGMHGNMLMKLIRITDKHVHMTLVTFSRSWV